MKSIKNSLLSVLICFFHLQGNSSETIGIVGGNSASNLPFAYFVQSDGTLRPINNEDFPSGTQSIRSVALNSYGSAIIGGGNSSNSSSIPYAALINSNGNIVPLGGGNFPSNGYINSVDINDSSYAIMGGKASGSSSFAYAALIAPDGRLTNLSGSSFPSNSGVIHSVAINSSGYGIIGGGNRNGGVHSYAALVRPNGTLVNLSNGSFPFTSGEIFAVDINSSGYGIIGGGDNVSNHAPAYVALISPDGTINQLTGGSLPSSRGFINSVAINDSGKGLIGGGYRTIGSPAYAAIVESDGSLVNISLPTILGNNGWIESVSINNAGAGIIGGLAFGGGPQNRTGYAALISPEGEITNLSDGSGGNYFHNYIYSVAINNEGIALIGGLRDAAPGYAAIVAPNGVVTQITSPEINTVNVNVLSVATSKQILNQVTPKSIGSQQGLFNAQFAASYALNSHMAGKYRVGTSEDREQFALLVLASKNLPYPLESQDESLIKENMLWFSPFGNYVHQKAQGDNPSSSNSIGGFLIGYDYSYSDLMFGAATGYAYNYLGFGSNTGHGSVQEELLAFYGSYEQDCLLVNFALWGGLYQLYNKRNILWFAASKAHTQGWTLTPHFEVATPFVLGNSVPLFFEPFALFDYVNNWQGGYTEQGSSGLNLMMDSHYSSVLRSEGGLRLFQEFDVNIGKFVFMQKMSYVNQLPFYLGSVMTSFVASSSSFPIAIGSSHVQNLGAIELRGTYLPENSRYPYFSFGFQGEFGSSYQSYFGNLEIGFAF